jgi:hypothetical protein
MKRNVKLTNLENKNFPITSHNVGYRSTIKMIIIELIMTLISSGFVLAGILSFFNIGGF